MLKKARAASEAEKGSQVHDLSKSVLESSRQIWLAGLGAFSKAQAGGMKVFEGLVQQGESFESNTKKAASQAASAARGAAKAKAQEMQALAGDTWDRLEHVFEQRVARALSKLGIHTQSDVDRLAARVDALSEAVNELIKATGVKPKRKPRATPMERMVKGAVSTAARTASSAARTATGAVSTAAKTATGAVSTATRTAHKTVRTATRVAKAALK
jgi:poly(hydroxyalkanoate) granule-associated protein